MARRFFYVCAGLLMLALSYHLGSGTAVAQAPTPEVAVLTGVLEALDTPVVPLPTYRDGTMALESECHVIFTPSYISRRALDSSSDLELRTIGRVLFTVSPTVSETPTRVSYMIIAVRGSSLPTTTRMQSFGQVKARYR